MCAGSQERRSATRRRARTSNTPPDGEARLRALLGNWEHFLREHAELDPLIRMAVAHYQFEAIHPFEDGNGRTGRIVNLLFLVGAGLLAQPVLYLSRAIIRTKADYCQLLLGVTTKDQWNRGCFYLLAAVTETAGWTTAKIRAMRDLHRTAREHIQRAAPKIDTRELVDARFEQPCWRPKATPRRYTALPCRSECFRAI